MNIARLQALTLATAVCAVLFPTPAAAQDPGAPVFAAPTRIKAGAAFLGEGRLYPSPVLHDVDGDKRPDIVVGDLFGKVTVARGVAGDKGAKSPLFGEEKPIEDRSGQPLKFHNW